MENIEKAKNSVTELGKSIKNNMRVVKRKASQGFGNTAGTPLPEYDKEEAVNAMISKIPSSPPAISNLTLKDADMSSQVTLRGSGVSAGVVQAGVPPNIPSHLHAYFANGMKVGPLVTAKALLDTSKERKHLEKDNITAVPSILMKAAQFGDFSENDDTWYWKELFSELRIEQASKKLEASQYNVDGRKNNFDQPKQAAKIPRLDTGKLSSLTARAVPNGDVRKN